MIRLKEGNTRLELYTSVHAEKCMVASEDTAFGRTRIFHTQMTAVKVSEMWDILRTSRLSVTGCIVARFIEW